MVFQPPPVFAPTPSLNLSYPPSSTDFPALSLVQARPGRSAGSAECTAPASRLRAQGSSIILPIGTERTSPARTTSAWPCPQEGEDTGKGLSTLDFQSFPGNGAENRSDQSDDGCESRDQNIWQQLQFLMEQRQTTTRRAQQYQPNASTQLHKPSYAEDISRYMKEQQDEVALRLAEDLAAGRAQPSGEGGFQPPPGPSDASNTTVFVGGLHHNVTEPELSKFFQPFGSICYVSKIGSNLCGS